MSLDNYSSGGRRKKWVKTPTVLQMEALECGAASLSMILGYYKRFVSLELLRIECGVSRDGTKASNILKAARKFGLECKGFRMEIEGLKNIELPAIIFWNFNHFVVFEGYKGKNAVINDPAMGRRFITPDEFDESFTGIVLVFKKTPQFEGGGSKPVIWDRLKKRLSGLQNIFVYLGFLSVLLFIPGFIYPSFSRFFIDNVLVRGTVNYIRPLITAMVITAIINAVLTAVQQKVLVRFQLRLGLSMASKFIYQIFKMY